MPDMPVHLILVSCSLTRYWLILLVTLVLNVMLIIYFTPSEEEICPIFFSFVNGTINPDFTEEYVISTFVLGSLYAFLVAWMILEHITVTWPHFVLPKFLYDISKYCRKVERYRCLSWITK